MAHNAEGRQDHDIDLGVAEEPEQMLEQHRVTTALGAEEGRAEIAVGDQHGDRTTQHRHRQQQQEGGDQHRPDKERHLVQRHARGAHIQDGGDEIRRTQDRGGTGQVQRKQRHIHRHPRLILRIRQRRINRPARTRALADKHRATEQQEGRRQQPEGNIVQPRKRHIRRTDHDRHKPIAEAANQRRHDHEEHHDQTMGRDHGIPGLAIGKDLQARLLQLNAHQQRNADANNPREEREDDVERADVFMIGAEQPARHKARGVVVVVIMRVGGRHGSCLSFYISAQAVRLRPPGRWEHRPRLQPQAPKKPASTQQSGSAPWPPRRRIRQPEWREPQWA